MPNKHMEPTIDATIAAVANKATAVGTAGTFLGWATTSEFGMWAGILIGVIGLVVNWYFKSRTNAREQALHEVYLRKMSRDSSIVPLKGPYADE